MSLRPNDPPKIRQGDMKPGDVILSASNPNGDGEGGLLARAILAIDQGDYTHSSIWDGAHVIESLTTGVAIDDPLSKTLDAQELVDVYRFCQDGKRFGDPDWPVEPMLDAARSFAGRKYGYADLVLCAAVLLAAETPKGELARIIVRLIGTDFAEQIEKILGETDAMICSEVVAEAYWLAEGAPPKKYALEILIDGSRRLPDFGAPIVPAVGAADGHEAHLAQTKARIARAFRGKHAPSLGTHPTALAEDVAPFVVQGGGPQLPAGFVTPMDLQRSPSLQMVGTLKQPGS